MMRTLDVTATDGRTVRAHDAGAQAGDRFTLLWHHGTPQTGALLEPVLAAARARNIRAVSYARPSYGGSTPDPGRDVASAAGDVERIAAALGLERFAVMGASGGGPHALACAALLPGRVSAAVCLGGVAPYTDDFDWFAGMAAPGGLRSARAGREARAEFARTEEFDESSFVAPDWAALDGPWAALGADAGTAGSAGPDGQIDDDVAFAGPWGFGAEEVRVPVLLAQGGADRVIPPSHAHSLLGLCPDAELWLRPRDGHISILNAVPLAMDWLGERV